MSIDTKVVSIFSIVWLTCIGNQVSGTCYSEESCLYEALFINSSYSSQVRPATSPYHSVDVSLEVSLRSILGLDEKNEVLHSVLQIEAFWDDRYLSYDESQYPVPFFLVQANQVWTPDFTITNNVKKFFDSTYTDDFKVYVTPSGTIYWIFGGIYETSCSMQLSKYPFDTQVCYFTIQNWAYIKELVDLINTTADLSNYAENSLWTLESFTSELDPYTSDDGLNYPRVIYTLRLRRLYSYYILNLILPCVLVTFAALGMFWLPPESGEKLSLGITVLLAYSVFQIVIMDTTPVNSQETPFISKLIISIMTLTTLSVIITMLTLFIHHKKPSSRAPKWLRVVAFKGIAKLLCIKDDLPQDNTVFIKRDNSVSSNMKVPQVKEDKQFMNSAGKNSYPKTDTEELKNLIEEVRFITNYLRDREETDAIVDEWTCLAKMIDRLCFWVFGSLFLLIVLPVVIVSS